ncbi:hypothetical protein ACRAWF_39005 [Streptomyces sp. L7]
MTCERRRPAGRAERAVEGVGDATPVIDNGHDTAHPHQIPATTLHLPCPAGPYAN